MKLSPHKRSEVDIRVADEISNHTNFMYNLNQAVQKLRTDFVELSLSCDKRFARADSDHKYLMIDVENIQEDLYLKHKDLEEKTSSLCSTVTDLVVKIQKDLNYLGEEKADVREVDEISSDLNKINKYVDKVSETSKAYHECSIKRFSSRLVEEVEKLRLEIKSLEPDFKPVKKEFADHFDIVRCDFKGLIKELQLIKKANLYSEKKFEDIYMLIGKLKAANK